MSGRLRDVKIADSEPPTETLAVRLPSGSTEELSDYAKYRGALSVPEMVRGWIAEKMEVGRADPRFRDYRSKKQKERKEAEERRHQGRISE